MSLLLSRLPEHPVWEGAGWGPAVVWLVWDIPARQAGTAGEEVTPQIPVTVCRGGGNMLTVFI